MQATGPSAHTVEAFDAHLAAVTATRRSAEAAIGAAGLIVVESLTAGGTCFALGNGGSAADAQHFVAELVGQFDGPSAPLAAIALTTDSSVLTSVANDLGFDEVFARQVRALARPIDVVVAISTSGSSPNVVRAAAAAHHQGCAVIALTGAGDSELASLADVHLAVESSDTQRIQEVHGLCLHALVAEVRARLEPTSDTV